MPSTLFFLSIHQPWVDMILAGEKRWEFRKNPRFGMLTDDTLAPGDRLLVVAMGERPEVTCQLCVGPILRGPEVAAYFGDPATGHWQEAGCRPDSERDWSFFQREILAEYQVAFKLEDVHSIDPIPLTRIRHRTKNKHWRGVGLTPARELGRYHIDGEEVDACFEREVFGRDR